MDNDAIGNTDLVRVVDIAKQYGETRALAGVTASVSTGEIVGLVGHNGAGKSTLMRVIGGTTVPDSGSIVVEGQDVTGSYTVDQARVLGIRNVYQELSLCPNLRVFENVRILHHSLQGRGWRMRASNLIAEYLNRIFPDHGISPKARVSDLSLGQRQMVEIARAASVTDTAVQLLILDEPTSSLDAEAAKHLFDFLRYEKARGMSCLFISHRLNEILENTDRVIVMRDGRIVGTGQSKDLSRDRLVEMMGDTTEEQAVEARIEGERQDAPIYIDVNRLSTSSLHDITMSARSGEIVGLAGLEGHGQQELLRTLFTSRRGTHRSGAVKLHADVAYVSGDRQEEGVFQFWSIAQNISLGAMGALTSWGLVRDRRERQLAEDWIERLKIKGSPQAIITDLSGGTQQKVLVARALASRAKIILFDDPTRGVDIGTKRQIYEMIRREAEGGRCFLWYASESEELTQCDRVYVFRRGRIVEELQHNDISEDRIIEASFRDAEEMIA